MEESIRVTERQCVIPIQIFNEKEYKLYDGERYFSRGKKRLHVEVWKYYKGSIPKGYHIHHVDGNTHNNNIKNLNLINGSLHLRYEGKKRFKENPEFAKSFHAKGIEKAKEWHKSEDGREWHRQHGKQSWINKQMFKKNCTVCGKEYETPFPTRSKFCHQNCKAKALRSRRKLSSERV
jgi:hypothetical protein